MTQENKKTFKEDFNDRIKSVKTSRWIRFTLVALIFLAWVAWMGSWWLAIFLLLLFDIYITGFIPFTWWKKSKNGAVRGIMSWIDAIVYALILVYFIFGFIGQNYQIPSSSLEKTLLTGDYLFVNKTVYGPRVPMTPVNFPLVHNKFPQWLGGGKSYLETPSVQYKRLKGLRSVEEGDIVVFNFPAGDTVVVNNPTTFDYYQLQDMYNKGEISFDATRADKEYYPVDRRENYVKRCVGLPGQQLKIVDGIVHIDGEARQEPENVQFNYLVSTNGHQFTDEEWDALDVNVMDRMRLSPNVSYGSYMYQMLADNGLTPSIVSTHPYYIIPLTAERAADLSRRPYVTDIHKASSKEIIGSLYPSALSQDWTRANYGGEDGILIPKKGLTVPIDSAAWALYERPIRVYENNPTAQFKDGKMYIDGQPQDSYTFKMDYYFMMGDNRDNSLDSRYWGFVPEDHIVGTPWRVLISFDQDRGGVRWNRIFKDANPDK